MNRSDMNILNILDAPTSIPEAVDYFTALDDVDAVIYYAYQSVDTYISMHISRYQR